VTCTVKDMVAISDQYLDEGRLVASLTSTIQPVFY
jgi:hypothetical protein